MSLMEEKSAKEDFIAPAQALRLGFTQPENEDMELEWNFELGSERSFQPSHLFHRQIGQFTNVPATYYDRMKREAPELLTQNVNHWMEKSPRSRMVRTVGKRARAFLSDRYRRLDSYDCAEVVIPIIQQMPSAEVRSCELTENKMYIKVILTDRTAEIGFDSGNHTRINEVVRAGFVISNSDVGLGSLNVDPLVEIARCINGLIMRDHSFKVRHVGASMAIDEEIRQLLTTETKEAEDKAIFLKFRDVVKATANEMNFERIVQRLQGATEDKIKGDPVKAIEVLSQKSRLTKDEQSSVLRHLIEGGDLSKWGVMNAVTRASQDIEDYDRATDLEILGGDIIVMPKQDWSTIATARA